MRTMRIEKRILKKRARRRKGRKGRKMHCLATSLVARLSYLSSSRVHRVMKPTTSLGDLAVYAASPELWSRRSGRWLIASASCKIEGQSQSSEPEKGSKR